MKAVWVALFVCAGCKDEPRQAPTRLDPVPVEKPPAPAPPSPTGSIRSPLPEKGPHPDYPTAAAAGTDKIFLLEEPDRGPPAPATFEPPARNTLTWTTAPFCEIEPVRPVCSKGPAGANGYRVGRGKGVTVIESLVGGQVDETIVYGEKADGSPAQRIRLDAVGGVLDARLFTQDRRFTGRALDGSNVLDGCGMLAYSEDKSKRVSELRCLQWLGDPMRDTSGVAIWKYERDASGFVAGVKRFGVDGAPVADTGGVHAVSYTRDSTGRVLLEKNFAVDGSRVVDTDGCAGKRSTYKDGLEIRTECLAANDGPIPDGDGVTIRENLYDSAGCLVKTRFLRDGDIATSDHDGLRGMEYTRGPHCFTESRTCIGEGEKSVACGPRQAARQVWARDAHGRIVSMKSFDAAGQPTGDVVYQAHELRWVRDARGNSTELTCFDASGVSSLCGTMDMHGWRETVDDAGRAITQTYIDRNNQPTEYLGISTSRIRYDNYDHAYETRTFDAAGDLYETSGSAIRLNLWDATHRLFAVQLLDKAGKPARYSGCYAGATCPHKPWHAVRLNRRSNGGLETNQFFDSEGQLIESVDCSKHPCFGSN